MLHFHTKRMVFTASLLLILAFFIVVPTANSVPGSSPATAPLLGNGTSIQTIPVGMINAYFNISGKVGDNVTIWILYDNATYQFHLYLRDQAGASVVTDTNPDGNQSVQYTLISHHRYCICLYRAGGSSSSAPVTLTISGLSSTENSIPGFTLTFCFLSLLGLFGVLRISKRYNS